MLAHAIAVLLSLGSLETCYFGYAILSNLKNKLNINSQRKRIGLNLHGSNLAQLGSN